MYPKFTTGKVTDGNTYVKLRARTIMRKNKRRTLTSRTLTAHYRKQSRTQSVHDFKVKCLYGGVIHNIPGTESQSMLTLRQSRNRIRNRTFGITAGYRSIIVIQRIGYFSIDTKRKIMSDTITHRIDTIFIFQLCNEIRSLVHLPPPWEIRSIQINHHLRPFASGRQIIRRSTNEEVTENSAGLTLVRITCSTTP